MNYATARLVFDRKHTATKEKTGLVQIEICFLRKRKWISTGIKVYKDQWNDKFYVVNTSNAVTINDTLKTQLSVIQEFINSLMKNNIAFSFDRLNVFLNENKDKSEDISFIDFITDRIENRKDIGEGTRKHHKTLIMSLKEFKKITFFGDITLENISRYDDFLHHKDLKQTTIYGYHKRLKEYINEAIRYDYIENNPYRKIKLDRGKSAGVKYLTMEELKTLIECDLESKHLIKARDLFIFQCYTGLSYSDLAKFDWKNVKKEGNDYIISDERVKTDENYYIVLLTPALKILKKYDFRLPIISNQKYNDFLKAVAGIAGINKPLTSHWARHTFATMMLSMGARMENVARMLGHANTKITESTYAKVLATDLRKEYDRINNKIKKLKD